MPMAKLNDGGGLGSVQRGIGIGTGNTFSLPMWLSAIRLLMCVWDLGSGDAGGRGEWMDA